MALKIKSIPVLTDKPLKNFLTQIKKNEDKRHSIDFTEKIKMYEKFFIYR